MIFKRVEEEHFGLIEEVTELSEDKLQLLCDELGIALKNLYFVCQTELTGEDKFALAKFVETVTQEGYAEVAFNDDTDIYEYDDLKLVISLRGEDTVIFCTAKYCKKIERRLDKYKVSN